MGLVTKPVRAKTMCEPSPFFDLSRAGQAELASGLVVPASMTNGQQRGTSDEAMRGLIAEWSQVLQLFRSKHGVEAWLEEGSNAEGGNPGTGSAATSLSATKQKLLPALQFLAFLGVGPNSVLTQLTRELCQGLRSRIKTLRPQDSAALMDACFRYAHVPELKDVVLEVLEAVPNSVPPEHLECLHHSKIFGSLPLAVRRQVWMHDATSFRNVMRGFIGMYAIYSAPSSLDMSIERPDVPSDSRRRRDKVLQRVLRNMGDEPKLHWALVTTVTKEYRRAAAAAAAVAGAGANPGAGAGTGASAGAGAGARGKQSVATPNPLLCSLLCDLLRGAQTNPRVGVGIKMAMPFGAHRRRRVTATAGQAALARVRRAAFGVVALVDKAINHGSLAPVAAGQPSLANQILAYLKAKQHEPEFVPYLDVLDKLLAADKNQWFTYPVDTTVLPNYEKVVSRPMDLSTVRTRLTTGQLRGVDEFSAEVLLIFDNALRYHLPKSTGFIVATNLRRLAVRALSTLRTKLKTSARSASNAAAAAATKAKGATTTGGAAAAWRPKKTTAGAGVNDVGQAVAKRKPVPAPKAWKESELIALGDVPLLLDILDEWDAKEAQRSFARPVSHELVPTYRKVIKQPMDLQTLRSNFMSSKYVGVPLWWCCSVSLLQ